MILRFLFSGFVALLLFTGVFMEAAQAHESRPLYVDLNEIQEHVFDVQWKIPSTVKGGNFPVLQIAGCVLQFEYKQSRIRGGVSRQGVLDCPNGVSEILIVYPRGNPSMSSLLHVRSLSGAVRSTLLPPGEMLWALPEVESGWSLSMDYAGLGVRHIWAGVDHLLFLVCLLMIAGSGRRIFITITGFTLAHSVTLSLAALGVFRVPIAPVEAVIALSIVFLAVEIVRGRRDSLTWRHPVLVSSSFGLLHGFGFASVLGEIGLPQGEIVNALLFFNVGVEIGQILFIVALIAVMAVLAVQTRFDIRSPIVQRWVAYGIGIVAAYWMVERIAGFLL